MDSTEKDALIEVVIGEVSPPTPTPQQQPSGPPLNPVHLNLNSVFPAPNLSSTPLIELDSASTDAGGMSPRSGGRGMGDYNR